MKKTLVDIGYFSVLLLLLIFVYSLIGMELFSQKAKFDEDKNIDLEHGESLDANFDSFLESFTTVFILLTEDGWSDIFRSYSRAVGPVQANIFFISLFIIGPRILLNIFLAILL